MNSCTFKHTQCWFIIILTNRKHNSLSGAVVSIVGPCSKGLEFESHQWYSFFTIIVQVSFSIYIDPVLLDIFSNYCWIFFFRQTGREANLVTFLTVDNANWTGFYRYSNAALSHEKKSVISLWSCLLVFCCCFFYLRRAHILTLSSYLSFIAVKVVLHDIRNLALFLIDHQHLTFIFEAKPMSIT